MKQANRVDPPSRALVSQTVQEEPLGTTRTPNLESWTRFAQEAYRTKETASNDSRKKQRPQSADEVNGVQEALLQTSRIPNLESGTR